MDTFLAMLGKEIGFLLSVFRQTIVEDPSRQIDLTECLYAAVDAVHKSAYSIMKHRLRTSKDRSPIHPLPIV